MPNGSALDRTPQVLEPQQRIKAGLAKANGILLALVRDVAEAAADDAAINAALPDDVDPLIPADFIARGRSGLDRKELKKLEFGCGLMRAVAA